jgi:two-component system sporulation sensor kinase B
VVGINDLLLNVLIIIICIFMYQIFWIDRINRSHKRRSRQNKWLITLLCGLAMILCMTFPFTLLPGNIYDLRKIPLLLGILYGGYKIGLLLTTVMIMYRVFLGGSGMYSTICVYTILLIAAMYLLPYFSRCILRKKIGLSSLLAGGASLIAPFSAYIEGVLVVQPDHLIFFGFYFIINALAMALSVYIIENILENMRLRMELQQAEKMHVLGELAASVAHEIRNPMTVSRGFMQLLKERGSNKEDVPYIDMAIAELDRAQEIISDYLTFAKPEAEDREKIEVSSHMEKIVTFLSPYAALHNIQFNMSLEKEVYISANPAKFRQCLINIIKNGIEAMPSGGEIEIRVKGEKRVSIIEIIDGGVGMENEEIERLGTPFYSTKEKGTGLGLMLCYRVIESLNGKIKVNSKKGEGTCFTIFIPQDSP